MTTQPLDPDSHGWRQPVAVAAGCAVLGLLILPAGAALPAPIAMIGLGAALVGASLLLSWAADAAEVEISGGLVLAGITLVTVLPELIVEVHFAYTQQTSLVSANLTGATRLLLTGATAMPVMGAWLLARRGQRAPSAAYRLAPARRVDLAVLFVAALYGVLLALLGRISLVDAAPARRAVRLLRAADRRNPGRAASRRRRLGRPRGSAAPATSQMAGGSARTVSSRGGGRRRSLHRGAPNDRYLGRDRSLSLGPVDRSRGDRDTRVRGRHGARAQSTAGPRAGRLPRCLGGPVDAGARDPPMGPSGGGRTVEPTAGHPRDGGGCC